MSNSVTCPYCGRPMKEHNNFVSPVAMPNYKCLCGAQSPPAPTREAALEATRQRADVQLVEFDRDRILRESRLAALTWLHDEHGIDTLSDVWLEALEISAIAALNRIGPPMASEDTHAP